MDEWRTRYEALERQLREDAEDFAELESILRRFVLRLCLASRGLGVSLDHELDRTTHAMRANAGLRELEPLLADLSNAVAATDTPVVAIARGTTEIGGSDDLRRALKSLLERLEIDPTLRERAAEIAAELETAHATPALIKVCASMVELVGAQKERLLLEKADVQRMMVQIDSRLHEFVSYLRGEAADRKAAADNQQALNAQMLGEVRGLTADVESATELGALQRQVRTHLESIGEHLRTFRTREQGRTDEFRERAERMRVRVEQLEHETRALQASLQREQINATTDALTGIPNRLAYIQRIALEFKRWKRFGRPLTIAAWDIDHFKSINDTYGHQVGDQVIRLVGRFLAKQLRETDFCARYGGEEFAVVLVDARQDEAMVVAEKLRRGVEALRLPIEGLRITVSCGVAEFRGDDDVDSVFERADRALYRAKQGGRNRCVQGA